MASIPIPRRYRSIVYIPSRSDGTLLEICISVPTTVSSSLPQAYTGVVIAHPYGPLGGSYNNNVVGALLQWFETYPLQTTRNDDYVYPTSSSFSSSNSANGSSGIKKKRNSSTTTKNKAEDAPEEEGAISENSSSQLVSLASVICAFNFRGCGKSKGRTSWFGEAEREDYQTVIDFLQSGGSPVASSTSVLSGGAESSGSGSSRIKVFDESGNEIPPPRLPFLSRFILSGFSYGGMIASTIPPPLRDPTLVDGPRLPTSYIFVSYPAGVAWFLTSGSHGSFAKRAKAILKCKESVSADSTGARKSVVVRPAAAMIEAYFITGSQDQFTSPKTLLSWLKTNTGFNPSTATPTPSPTVIAGGPKIKNNNKTNQQQQDLATCTSWGQTRPDVTIHVDILDGVDHFWLDREQELLDRLQAWWTSSHPV
ncbi:hypothetical protein BG004_000170 [Podila humilis]|nr:hypothetical protein BG004_000170 [Podila humilis]